MNNMQLLLNQILRNYEIDISDNETIHVYFHKYGSPLDKVTNGNHFGYLEPIDSPQIALNCNTIEQISIDSNIGVLNDTWTDNDKKELYICYCLAKLRKLKVINGTYSIWKERNPLLWPCITAYAVSYTHLTLPTKRIV